MRLQAVRDRYFRPVIAFPEGHLCHHGDCDTHRAMEIYKYAPCTCGLLHDLKMVESSIVNKIYPKYNEDYGRQDAMVPGSFYWLPEAEKVEARKHAKDTIKQFFGEPRQLTPDEWKQVTERDWNLIEQVFGAAFRVRAEAAWAAEDESE
jgi:hypothetical protein